jgi:membrane protease YdiL (CAAX protease family)
MSETHDETSSSLPLNVFTTAVPAPLASRRHTIRFLLIVCGIAFIGVLQTRQASVASHPSRVLLYLSLAGLQLLFVWFVRLGIRARKHSILDLFGKRWSSWKDATRDIILGVLFVVVLRVCSELLQHLLGRPFANVAFLLPHNLAESVLWTGVATIAGICEEIVYRGYLQPQLWALSRSLPLSIAMQAIIFGAAHAYQGWRPALITAVYGVAFGLLVAWRKSIIPGAIAHSLIDIIGGLLRR